MKTQTIQEVEFTEKDVKAAKKSLDTASFKERIINTGCNVADPVWKANGIPISEQVKKQLKSFSKEVEKVGYDRFRTGVFQKYDSNTLLTIGFHDKHILVPPKPRDLLHVYGADRDNLKDASKYYRYAWTEKGPNAQIFYNDQEMIRTGKLGCNSYAYSGQSSYAIAGVGMFFRPLFGDAKVNIKPFVQWMTSVSFTGTENAPASANASLGIYVESRNLDGSGYFAEPDFPFPLWSQNTQGFMTQVPAGGTASVTDGFAKEILCVTQRKYYIFVYVYVETTAGPQQGKNELRYVTLDIDAVVPFVALQETLI
jgi:hypothetical protein